MKIANNMLTRFGVSLRARNKRIAAMTIAALSLWFFGDTLLPLIGHGLHLLIEVVELAFEHLLEWVFGLSRRAAQAITFWTGFILIVYGSFRLLRRAYTELQRAWHAVVRRVHHWTKEERPIWAAHPYTRLTLTLGAISATVYLLA